MNRRGHAEDFLEDEVLLSKRTHRRNEILLSRSDGSGPIPAFEKRWTRRKKKPIGGSSSIRKNRSRLRKKDEDRKGARPICVKTERQSRVRIPY